MEIQDIPVEQHPSINQLKNRRPLKKGKGDKYPCAVRGWRKIEELFRPEDLEPVETQADGTCQFLAVLFSAGIPLNVYQFR